MHGGFQLTCVERHEVDQDPDVPACGVAGQHHQPHPKCLWRVAGGDIDQDIDNRNGNHHPSQKPNDETLQFSWLQQTMKQSRHGDLGQCERNESKDERDHVPQHSLLQVVSRELVRMSSISVMYGDGCRYRKEDTEYL